MQLEPFLVTPRLDTKPWGGTRLAARGFATDDPEPLGEVVLTATENRVAGGPHAGMRLGDRIRAEPNGMMGRRGWSATRGRVVFPLLVKLIDAAKPLSIQVHPDDERGAAIDSLGKTEAWHVLAADPEATLFAGVVEGVRVPDVAEAAQAADGRTARHLRQLETRVGATIFLPAGTLHALGAGVMIYELQQASEITYRLDDWGRVGADGKARPMHVAESLEAMDPELRPEIVSPIRLSATGPERDLLVACRLFALDRFLIDAGQTARLIAFETPQTVTVVRGVVELHASGRNAGPLRVEAGQTAIVPASVAIVEAGAVGEEAELLRAWVPDLAAEVVRPALEAGASPEALIGLSAPLSDVAIALDEVLSSRPSTKLRSSRRAADP